MILPIEIATWLEECGVPISLYTVQQDYNFVSIFSPLDITILNGQLVYYLLVYIGKKFTSTRMPEHLRGVKLQSGSSQFTISNNWVQLFQLLSVMGIIQSDETKRKIIDDHGLILHIIAFFIVFLSIYIVQMKKRSLQ